MRNLIYIQKFVDDDGNILALAPSIAGFLGTYTALVPGQFCVSYNVRDNPKKGESKHYLSRRQKANDKKKDIWTNLELLLDPEYNPL